MAVLSVRPIKRKMIPRGGWWCFGLIGGWLLFPLCGWCEPPASPAPQPESFLGQPTIPQAASPSENAAETEWRPLGEVIQRYSETTGNPIRIHGGLQENDKLFNQMYSVNDPSWLEDFSRIEIFNEESGKKEIILLNRKPGAPSGPTRLTSGSPQGLSRRNKFGTGLFRKRVSEKIKQAQTKQKALAKQNAKSKSPKPDGQPNQNNKKSPPPKHP